MKFSQTKPSIFDRLHKTFGVEWGGTLVIAYKDTIYHSKPLDPSVIIHEQIHLNRQGKDADGWYESYIRDKKFRFGEELLAYRAQFSYLKAVTSDRNQVARHLFRLASELSGPMYGRVIGHREALKLIKMT